MTPADLARRGEALHQALGREYYLAGAGLKPEPAFQPIYDQYQDLQTPDALDAARGSGVPALLEWAVDLRVGRATAALDERQIAWEQAAVVTVNGRAVPYLRAGIEIKNTADRAARRALDGARTALAAAGLTGLRRDKFQIERDITCGAAGVDDYVRAIEGLSGVDLAALDAACQGMLDETADLYRDALTRLAARRLHLPLRALERSDAAWLFRAGDWDRAFGWDAMVPLAERHMRDLGLDARQEGRVVFDIAERAGKQPRAFCIAVRVPAEVYLVLRPSGGHADYRTFWHELGHAMHFAAIPAEAPFHARWLGDSSVTEGFAMLWDHLTIDPRWLAHYAPHAGLADLAFELAVNELFMLRRYAAKLGYERWLHRHDLDHAGPEYAGRLSAATLFRYPEADALLDVDSGFYSARYLRAWQLEAAWARAFTERHDADWWRNPAAGATVLGLMRRGQAEPAERMAAAAGAALSFAPAIERLVETLG